MCAGDAERKKCPALRRKGGEGVSDEKMLDVKTAREIAIN